MTERWLPIVGATGYEVSDQGRVRGVDRVVPRGSGTQRVRGQILRPIRSGNGLYLTVSLKQNGKQRGTYIHRAVAEAFLGPCPAGMECCHANGDGTDNRLSNLRWDTHPNNEQDKVRLGTHHQLRKTHCPQNHPYDEANTYVWVNPKTGGRARMCRTCIRARQAA